MVHLIQAFEKVGFILQEDGSYAGHGVKNNNTIIFKFANHYLICAEDSKPLFSILYADLSVETLYTLLCEFGILQKSVKN
jgi:hypothetical protein